MADISHSLALEIADNWEQMAETETQAPPGRRATLRECADLLRMMASPPAPEPDRAEALACELWKLGETPILGEKEAIIRRHFDELRAEWEAERQQAMETRPAPEPVDPAIEWTRKVLAEREARSDTATRLNILKGVHDDKFWFKRALAVVREALSEAKRPVIDVPEDVAKWAKHRRTQFNQGGWISNAERDACDFILQLAKRPSQ